MTDLIIQGIFGRMGKALRERIAQREDCRIVAGVDASSEKDLLVPVFPTLSACDVPADAVIDFSHPSATDALLEACVAKRLPCVVCTTGLTDATLQHLARASEQVAVFQSANMSLGVNVLLELCRRASALLGTDYDIEIIEKHHRNKLDAPSGTALMIADSINAAAHQRYHYVYDRHAESKRRTRSEIGISAVRGGSIVGEHEVLFCGPDEVLTLSHSASSRDVFAGGAVAAAMYLAGKPAGMYSMKDLIG